jgi:hypothetical protein
MRTGVVVAGMLLGLWGGGQPPALAQESVDVQSERIVISSNVQSDVINIFGDGADTGTADCPGIIVVNPATGQTSLVFTGCSSDLFLGSTGEAGGINVRDATNGSAVVLDGAGAELKVGTIDNAGDVLLNDTDGTTTVELDGEFGSLTLGNATEDGDIVINDSDPDIESFRVDGNSGNVTNQLAGNGTVKAWAKVASNGNIVGCWRCVNANTRNGTGDYAVDFSPLGEDITSRPRTAVIDTHGANIGTVGFVTLGGVSADIYVGTRDISGNLADRSFTVFVY